METWFDNEHPGLRRFWHPVAAIDELDGPGPHAVRLLGVDRALARLGDEWTLLPDRCPHRLAPLTAGTIVDDQLRCSYHGWCFDPMGTCVEIPALGAAATIPPSAHLEMPWGVEERYGLIWVAIDEPLLPIPEIPEWGSDRFGLAVVPTQSWNASAAQMADNFLDVAHFPFTHLGTIGDPDDVEVQPFEVTRDDWTFESEHHHSSKVFTDATSGAGSDGEFTTFDRTMRFRCWAPHHVRLFIDYGPDGDLLLFFFHQPVDATTTRLYCLIMAENIKRGDATRADHIAFQTEVAREDRSLLERLKIKAVPLNPGVETHTRADKSTLELRRMLSDLDALVATDPATEESTRG